MCGYCSVAPSHLDVKEMQSTNPETKHCSARGKAHDEGSRCSSSLRSRSKWASVPLNRAMLQIWRCPTHRDVNVLFDRDEGDSWLLLPPRRGVRSSRGISDGLEGSGGKESHNQEQEQAMDVTSSSSSCGAILGCSDVRSQGQATELFLFRSNGKETKRRFIRRGRTPDAAPLDCQARIELLLPTLLT